MKTSLYTALMLLFFISCSSDSKKINSSATFPDFLGVYTQEDQMGKPAVNMIFSENETSENKFNLTIPSEMKAAFQSDFQARLKRLNPDYTTNSLTLNATDFTNLMVKDVLIVNIKKDEDTTFDNFTGRALSDDVMDSLLKLIYGGSDGTKNTSLTSDHVGGNDKLFLTGFPYLAFPW